MRRARIKILSEGDGWKQRLDEPCTVTDDKNIQIVYSDGGDSCTLTIADDRVSMSRRGMSCLDLYFKRGETTCCYLGLEGGTGEVDCFTSRLDVVRGSRGINLKLKYMFGGSEITLSATIIYNYNL